jgi:hypothetical protein
MFGVYELIKQQMVASRGLTSTQQLSHSDLLLAGGLGGTAFWLGCYPVGKYGKLQLHFDVSAAVKAPTNVYLSAAFEAPKCSHTRASIVAVCAVVGPVFT